MESTTTYPQITISVYKTPAITRTGTFPRFPRRHVQLARERADKRLSRLYSQSVPTSAMLPSRTSDRRRQRLTGKAYAVSAAVASFRTTESSSRSGERFARGQGATSWGKAGAARRAFFSACLCCTSDGVRWKRWLRFSADFSSCRRALSSGFVYGWMVWMPIDVASIVFCFFLPFIRRFSMRTSDGDY